MDESELLSLFEQIERDRLFKSFLDAAFTKVHRMTLDDHLQDEYETWIEDDVMPAFTEFINKIT